MAAQSEKKTQIVPSDADFGGTQLSLFQSFLCNTDEGRDRLSNTVELWDSIPKYSVSQQAMNKARTDEGLLEPLEKEFVYRERKYRVIIQAAVISEEISIGEKGEREKSDSNLIRKEYKAYYPSSNEELVEDALRKIAAEQYKGFFDKPTFKSGVVFSLYLLRRELKKRGHTRSYQEIVRSLNILAKSNIEILFADGRGIAVANYLPVMAAVTRERLTEDPTAKWVVHFHPLVTDSIDKLSYRQYNYHLMMSHSSHLARWLHKRLSHNYVNASYDSPYNILLSSVRRNSGLLEYGRPSDARNAFEKALQELVDKNLIMFFEKEETRGARNKIVDVKYLLTPHFDFVRDVKAANKRQRDASDELNAVSSYPK
ncbi:replication protein [Candidatus Entotheonella serta]|nr:replication protein [Candidatus Entotheonella serta]